MSTDAASGTLAPVPAGTAAVPAAASAVPAGPVVDGADTVASPAQRAAATCPHLSLGVPDATISVLLVDACAAPLALIDRCGHFLRVNSAFLRLVGRTGHDVVGTDVTELLPIEGVAQAVDLAQRAAAGRPVEPPESLWVDELGHRRRVAWTFTGAPTGRVPVYVIATGVDVTRERLAEASWRQRAQTDHLTGLANRTALESVLEAHLAPDVGTGCGVLFCDLDGFKAVNDTYGHAVGDQVLVEVAQRLASSVRTTRGDVVARLGGDEFVVVLPGCGELELRAVVPRIERAVARPLRLDVGLVRVGVSIGARVADPGDDVGAVLSEADEKMYRAKSARKERRRAADAAAG